MGGLSIVFSFWLFLMTCLLGTYFLPTIIAVVARRRNAVLVAIVNTLLGWSFVGWIVALVMAVTREPEPQIVLVNQASAPTPVTYDDVSYRSIPGSNIRPR
jgi:hypothetical protein